jgi:hypothetical protein
MTRKADLERRQQDLPHGSAKRRSHGHLRAGHATWPYDLLNVAIGGVFLNRNKGSRMQTPATVPEVPLFANWVAMYKSV